MTSELERYQHAITPEQLAEIEAGWAVVAPMEPTVQMLTAGQLYTISHVITEDGSRRHTTHKERARKCYAAMIAARPKG